MRISVMGQLLSRTLRRSSIVMVGMTLFGIAVLLTSPVIVGADSSIAQSFKSDTDAVSVASLVAMKKGNANTVEPSTVVSNDRLVGIVGAKPLVQLSDGTYTNTVQVVTSGITLALVSDINGDIVNGDKITTSPIEGVGMKATTSSVVVGVAQTDLASSDAKDQTISDKNGKQQTVRVGTIPVQVSVAYYTIGTDKPSFVPSALQELANTIAGKNVSPIRVLVAGLIVLLLFVSVTVILYSAIRSSLISIGRNPLSERAVRKSLAGVGRTLIAVFVCTMLALYIVLAV